MNNKKIYFKKINGKYSINNQTLPSQNLNCFYNVICIEFTNYREDWRVNKACKNWLIKDFILLEKFIRK